MSKALREALVAHADKHGYQVSSADFGAGYRAALANQEAGSITAEPAFVYSGQGHRALAAAFDGYDHGTEFYAGTPPTKGPEGWISVAERVPAAHDYCLLALSTGTVVVGTRFSAGLWDWPETDDEADTEAHITHWMPFPEAPADSNEGSTAGNSNGTAE